MSGSVNKAILVGNLGADPDIRDGQNGEIANLNLATSERWKDKSTGEQREKTEWHRVVLFGAQAGIAAKYLRKGSKIYLEGKLQTRKWQDKDGNDRYTTEVVGNHFVMLDSKQDGERPAVGGPKAAPFDDEIPF